MEGFLSLSLSLLVTHEFADQIDISIVVRSQDILQTNDVGMFTEFAKKDDFSIGSLEGRLRFDRHALRC